MLPGCSLSSRVQSFSRYFKNINQGPSEMFMLEICLKSHHNLRASLNNMNEHVWCGGEGWLDTWDIVYFTVSPIGDFFGFPKIFRLVLYLFVFPT